MVRACRWGGLAALIAVTLGASPDDAPTAGPVPPPAVPEALARGSFPWYDPARDAVKAVDVTIDPEPTPAPSPERSPRAGWGPGDVIAFAGFSVAIAALVALLAWFWRSHEPTAGEVAPGSSRPGGGRVEELPAGLRREVESSDPWDEATRRRDRGDLAGAVVCLFAHQLLTLSRLGLVRIAPGRTGRQLLHAVADAEARRLVLPTLGLFESVYYGHRTPTAEEFAAVWAGAEAFERRAAAKGAP